MKIDRRIGPGPYLLAAVALVGALATGVYLSYLQSLHELQERAESVADEVLGRSNAISDEFHLVLKVLRQDGAVLPCSPADIERTRRLAIGARNLRAVGYVQGDRLMCSSYGRHGQGIPIGAISYTSSLGFGIRPRVQLPFAGDENYLVSTELASGYTAIMLPGQALDLRVAIPDLVFGVYGLQSRRSMLHRGSSAMPQAWLDRPFGEAGTLTFPDGDHLVVMKRSRSYDLAAYAALPLTAKTAAWIDYGRVLVPLSLIAGLAMAALIIVYATQRKSMPNQLRRAMRRGELFLEYQPVVDLQTGRWVGAEALLRWRRPDGTRVPPDQFIPMAERNGLMGAVTARVIELFARDAAGLLQLEADFDISLNLSAGDLTGLQFAEQLKSTLERADIQAKQVIVEITERVLVQAEEVQQQIQVLRGMGVRVAIDDFGTGYSGLSQLTRLALDFLKIDKTFVDTIGTDAATKNVVDHIIEIAKSQGLVMVAEGVETQAQADYLRQHGVQFVQGWLYARALPMDQLKLALAKQRQAAPT